MARKLPRAPGPPRAPPPPGAPVLAANKDARNHAALAVTSDASGAAARAPDAAGGGGRDRV
ncbi:hypothetical protein WME99_13750 [Sorangium sp. So ce136]|uniref:hypothetical protein n=1 Tax=Sorangium sp. So ce136 TaxID=3133284 RepID=UPI003F088CBB